MAEEEQQTPKTSTSRFNKLRRLSWRTWLVLAVATIFAVGGAYLLVQYQQQLSSLNASKTQRQAFDKQDDTNEKSVEAREAFEAHYFDITTHDGRDVPADLSKKDIERLKDYLPDIGEDYQEDYQDQITLLEEAYAVQQAYHSLLVKQNDAYDKQLRSDITTQDIYDFNTDNYPRLEKMQALDEGNRFASRMIKVQTELGQEALSVDNVYYMMSVLFNPKTEQSPIQLKRDVTPDQLNNQLSAISDLSYVWPNMSYLRSILNQAMPYAQQNQARIAAEEAKRAAESSRRAASEKAASQSRKKAQESSKKAASESRESDEKDDDDESESSSRNNDQRDRDTDDDD
jgi:hypothetical protein